MHIEPVIGVIASPHIRASEWESPFSSIMEHVAKLIHFHKRNGVDSVDIENLK